MPLYTLLYLKWITNNDLMHSMGEKKNIVVCSVVWMYKKKNKTLSLSQKKKKLCLLLNKVSIKYNFKYNSLKNQNWCRKSMMNKISIFQIKTGPCRSSWVECKLGSSRISLSFVNPAINMAGQGRKCSLIQGPISTN